MYSLYKIFLCDLICDVVTRCVWSCDIYRRIYRRIMSLFSNQDLKLICFLPLSANYSTYLFRQCLCSRLTAIWRYINFVLLLLFIITRRRDHITLVLRQLHRLPVQQRVEFKLAVLMFKVLNCLALTYLSDDCQLVSATSRRQLLSICSADACAALWLFFCAV